MAWQARQVASSVVCLIIHYLACMGRLAKTGMLSTPVVLSGIQSSLTGKLGVLLIVQINIIAHHCNPDSCCHFIDSDTVSLVSSEHPLFLNTSPNKCGKFVDATATAS